MKPDLPPRNHDLLVCIIEFAQDVAPPASIAGTLARASNFLPAASLTAVDNCLFLSDYVNVLRNYESTYALEDLFITRFSAGLIRRCEFSDAASSWPSGSVGSGRVGIFRVVRRLITGR